MRNLNNPKINFDQEISSEWAIKSISMCKKKYQYNQIDFVIGSDLLIEMCLWKNIIQILNEAKLYIIPREGYPINSKNLKFINNNKGNYEISILKIPKISSSMIRSSLNFNNLPKSIIPIIKENNLYNLK